MNVFKKFIGRVKSGALERIKYQVLFQTYQNLTWKNIYKQKLCNQQKIQPS